MSGYFINSNFFDFLMILIVGLAASTAVLAYVVLRRRSVVTWQSDTCCIDVPHSAECASRMQAIHQVRYENGLRDALAYPNRVQELIRRGRALDPRGQDLDGRYGLALDGGYGREPGGYHPELDGLGGPVPGARRPA
jgi:hypothetical protein